MSFMHGRNKFLIIGIAIVLILLLIKYSSMLSYQSRQEKPPVFKPRPPLGSTAISFDEFLNEAKPIFMERNSTLMLPTWLPNNLRPVAVWVLSGEWLIAYSDKYTTELDKVPLTIEVSFLDEKLLGPSLYNDTIDFLNKEAESLRAHGRNVTVMKINEFFIEIIWDYPKGYHIDADVYDLKDNIMYHVAIRSSIKINYNDFVKMIESFEPVKFS